MIDSTFIIETLRVHEQPNLGVEIIGHPVEPRPPRRQTEYPPPPGHHLANEFLMQRSAFLWVHILMDDDVIR